VSKICVPLNSTFLVMLDLWGLPKLPKLHNLLGRLLNTTPTQLIYILVSMNATKIMSFFVT
jgi:hypothetical protein